jgi:hypothetical protein
LARTFSVPADALVRVVRKNATTMRAVVAEGETFFTLICASEEIAGVERETWRQ